MKKSLTLFLLTAILLILPGSSRAQEALQHPVPRLTDPGHTVLRPWHGRPTVWRDGVPLPMPAYLNSILGWGNTESETRWKNWTDHFIRSGVKVFFLDMGVWKGNYGQSSLWTDEGVYADTITDEPMSTDKRAQYILSRVPDALFVVRTHTYAPKAWMDKNPGELSTDSAGATYQPTWASEKYLSGVSEYLKRFVTYHESTSWKNRILGYIVIPLGEGYTLHSIEGHFYDRSAAMQRAWRAFLTQKYSTDDALRKAWGNETATLPTATIPLDSTLREKADRLPQWPSGSQMRVERDYALLQKQIHERWFRTMISSVKAAVPDRQVLVGIDALKQPMLGWQIQEFYTGRSAGTRSYSLHLATGSFGVGPLMDMPQLSTLSTPSDYTARQMGSGHEVEGLADSMVLRGKTLMNENDTRTFLSQELGQGRYTMGTFHTLAEVNAGLQRNTALALSRGLFHYYTDIATAGSYYGSEEVQREVRLDKTLYQRGTAWPHRETEHAIAVIIDDESPLYENFTSGFQQLAVIRQRVEGLALAGIPYRIHLLSDLKRPDFPAFRCYYFPNLFKVDADTISLLKRKVFRDGRVAIFGPGTGITDGEDVSARGAEALLGIPMQLTPLSSSRRVRLNGVGLGRLGSRQLPAFYGDSLVYGPILSPDPGRFSGTGVQTLGDLVSTWSVSAPGLVLREFGRGAAGNGKAGARAASDYAVVFSAALPMPAPLLRATARFGGTNVWCDNDVVVTASDTLVSIHATAPGPYTIHLPRRCRRVLDALTGKVIGENVRQIRIKLQPPQTRTFLLDPS